MNSEAILAEPRHLSIRGYLTGYYELSKPRVLLMILITALAGFYMGAARDFEFAIALKMLLGVGLAAAGTLALNQYIECDIDAIMRRTRMRPIPSGRLAARDGLVFGVAAAAAGIGFLWLTVNPLSAIVTATITALYLGAYTPMKRHSWSCHVIGAVPGALPPVIGWAAARNSLAFEPFVLFGVMFLWQLPHSLSIARLYQEDYARAGLSLLPKNRSWGNPATAVMVIAAASLTLFGALPAWMGFAGRVYLPIALLLGVLMFYYVVQMMRGVIGPRKVMFASLLYLPAVLLVMVLDKL